MEYKYNAKVLSLKSGFLSKILHRLNTQTKLILVGNHTEVSTGFLYQVKTDWKLLKTRAIPSLIILSVTEIVSFLLFLTSFKGLVFTGLQTIFIEKWYNICLRTLTILNDNI